MTLMDDKPLFDLGGLFGDERVNHGDPDEDFVWKWPENLTVEEKPEITLHLADGSTHLMAQFVWQSSITMSNLIAIGDIDVRDKIILEVGAGAALPSIVSAFCGATKVMVTDYPEESIVLNMQRNINENIPERLQSNVSVFGYAWGTDINTILSECDGKLDYVLLADTLWLQGQHHNLLKSLEALAQAIPNMKCIFTYMNHDDGRGVAKSFFQLATTQYHFQQGHYRTIDWRVNKDKFEEDEDPENFGEYGPVRYCILEYCNDGRDAV